MAGDNHASQDLEANLDAMARKFRESGGEILVPVPSES